MIVEFAEDARRQGCRSAKVPEAVASAADSVNPVRILPGEVKPAIKKFGTFSNGVNNFGIQDSSG